MEANAGIICRVCHWFGVFRSDVAAQLSGCPSCGNDTLELRDLDDASWREVSLEALDT